jgi:SAM-dependent methyltransferase
VKRRIEEFIKSVRTAENVQSVYVPYNPRERSFVLRKISGEGPDCRVRPVPPRDEWISDKYGNTPDEYLASGQRDLQDMNDVLTRAGVSLRDLGNILDFGCGDGRMTRWLEDLAGTREVWGVDIDARRIFWCKQHLTPSLRFLTTTTVPHLPFEDRHFGFVMAGSVFTHIDDLADAWIAELRRILRPGGKLFMTVHLKDDICLLSGRYRDSGLAKLLRSHPEYQGFTGADFDVFTIGRSSESFVFYDFEFLRRAIEPLFRILSVTREIRLYQNALLLERV